jgi:modulator of FtsH protease HflK
MFAFFMVVIVGLSIWSSYYTVPSDSVAVVERFGKYLKEVPPGLHFKLPLGIDTTFRLPVMQTVTPCALN